MSDNAASEDELGHLHNSLTSTLRRLCEVTTIKQVVKDKTDGSEEVVEIDFIPSAGLLSVAATFLKNNQITATTTGGLDDLERVLADRRQAGKPAASVNDEDALGSLLDEIAL